jgi:hypothetical protein
VTAAVKVAAKSGGDGSCGGSGGGASDDGCCGGSGGGDGDGNGDNGDSC